MLVQEPLEPLGGLAQLGDKGEVAHLMLMFPHETHQLGLCLTYLLWGVTSKRSAWTSAWRGSTWPWHPLYIVSPSPLVLMILSAQGANTFREIR